MDTGFCTFNIRYDTWRDCGNRWSRRREQVYRLWRRHAWGVVGVQEALHSQVLDLDRALPNYGFVGVGRDDGAAGGEYSPIFYRRDLFEPVDSGTFWLSDTPDAPGSKGWDATLPRICTWARLRHATDSAMSPFTVYNTHTDSGSQQARERGVAVILGRMADASPERAVLMGDFNATDDNPAVAPIRAAGLSNTFPPGTDSWSYHGFTGRNREGKIDHIFATRDWRILGAWVVTEHEGRRYPSDHFPVTAALEIS